MSSDDITQRAISHSLTLNNFQAKTKPACPQFGDMRERMCLIDLAWSCSLSAHTSQQPDPRQLSLTCPLVVSER